MEASLGDCLILEGMRRELFRNGWKGAEDRYGAREMAEIINRVLRDHACYRAEQESSEG